VTEIVSVPGRLEDGIVEVAPLFETSHGRIQRAGGWPPHPERFQAAGVDLSALLRPPGPERGSEDTVWVP
jgi:pilus assembly protein CpaF